MKNKSFQILSLEAKDIYEAMRFDKSEGYLIRNKDGEFNLKRFSNTLDYSLDCCKVQEIYGKVTRRKDFSFAENGKDYTQVIVNVNFNYSYRLFNKRSMGVYIKDGYALKDCNLVDRVAFNGDELIAIQTGAKVNNPLPQDILGKYFTYSDDCYVQTGSIPVLMRRSDLRHHFYENGFKCDGFEYVRYKRSSGSSRVGKCLFILERVADRMERWDKCGLDIEDGDSVDLAALEAYKSLTLSSIIDTVEIYPENILVIEDKFSKFKEEVIAVEAEGGVLTAGRKTAKIKNNIWDGQSLLDSELFGKYSDCGMLVLRNRFFKTCAFNTNIRQWFEDNGIYDISQLKGKTTATDISQIKLITTPSSIKYLKFGTLNRWLKKLDPVFGIVKHEKETPFFNGRMARANYQLLNTLQLSEVEIEEFLKQSLDYLRLLRSDPDILRYHIAYPFRQFKYEEVKIKNDIVFKMLGINNKFAYTKLYKEFRNNLVAGFVRRLKRGKILVSGNYATMFGNGLEMLQEAIGRFSGQSEMQSGSIYCKHFKDGERILGSRSPHITMGNVFLAKNIQSAAVDKYFNLTDMIVCVNAIGENIQQRLNGCDYDSDAMLLTNNQLLIKVAEKNYHRFPVPAGFVKSEPIERRYTAENKAALDISTSVNKIGEIINLSQLLNSIYWDKVAGGASEEECETIYLDICCLAVLSCIEIDRAKKEVAINSCDEITRLTEKYRIVENEKTVKPLFFKTIAVENGFELSENIEYRGFNTAMDYLLQHVDKTNRAQARQCKSPRIKFMDIIKKPDSKKRQGNCYNLRDRVIALIRKVKTDILKLRISYDKLDSETKTKNSCLIAEMMRNLVDQINKIGRNEYTMYLILREIEKPENSDICKLMFDILFQTPITAFYDLILHSKEPLFRLVECAGGEIKLFDFNFMKEAV